MVNAYRLETGRAHLHRFSDVFARAEETYGVPGPVIAAFWGLETDYGAVQGGFDTLGALATLAHDCRRPELFRSQLIDALRLVDRGYLNPRDLVGAWAGELGQIQMLPSGDDRCLLRNPSGGCDESSLRGPRAGTDARSDEKIAAGAWRQRV
jgi:membrane-bound lytic murein transglycosylase B